MKFVSCTTLLMAAVCLLSFLQGADATRVKHAGSKKFTFTKFLTFYATRPDDSGTPWWTRATAHLVHDLSSFKLFKSEIEPVQNAHFDVALELSLKNANLKKHVPLSGRVVAYLARAEAHEVRIPDLCANSRVGAYFAEVYPFTLEKGTDTAGFRFQQAVPRDGLWLSVVRVCGAHRGLLHVHKVAIVPVNAFGHLPGHMLWAIPACLLSVAFYLALSTVWVALCAKWAEFACRYHYLMLAGIYLACVEAVLQLLILNSFNKHGLEGNRGERGAEGIAASLGRQASLQNAHIASKLVLNVYFRLLFGFLALGIGVTRVYADLGRGHKLFIFGFNAAYAVLFVVYKLRFYSFEHGRQTARWDVMAISALDSFYFYVLFAALSDLFDALRARSQFAKFRVYQRLGVVLFVAMLASLAFAFVQLKYFVASARWQFAPALYFAHFAFTDGAWRALFAGVFAFVLHVFKPRKNLANFIQSEQLKADADDAVMDAGDDFHRCSPDLMDLSFVSPSVLVFFFFLWFWNF